MLKRINISKPQYNFELVNRTSILVKYGNLATIEADKYAAKWAFINLRDITDPDFKDHLFTIYETLAYEVVMYLAAYNDPEDLKVVDKTIKHNHYLMVRYNDFESILRSFNRSLQEQLVRFTIQQFPKNHLFTKGCPLDQAIRAIWNKHQALYY